MRDLRAVIVLQSLTVLALAWIALKPDAAPARPDAGPTPTASIELAAILDRLDAIAVALTDPRAASAERQDARAERRAVVPAPAETLRYRDWIRASTNTDRHATSSHVCGAFPIPIHLSDSTRHNDARPIRRRPGDRARGNRIFLCNRVASTGAWHNDAPIAGSRGRCAVFRRHFGTG